MQNEEGSPQQAQGKRRRVKPQPQPPASSPVRVLPDTTTTSGTGHAGAVRCESGGLDTVLPPNVLDVIVGMLLLPPFVSLRPHPPPPVSSIPQLYTPPTAVSPPKVSHTECLFPFARCSHKCWEACTRVSLVFNMKTSCARRELKDLKEARSAITDGTRHRKLLRMQMGELETLSAFAKALIERKEWELQVADAKPADLEGEEDARWEYLDAKSQASLRKFFEGIRVIQCHNELSLSDDQSFSGVIMFEVSGGNAQVFMFSVGDVSVGERNGKVESGEIRLGFCVMNRGDPIPPPPLSEMATYGSIPKPWLPLAKRDYYSEWHAWSMNSSHTRKESLATSPVKQLLVLSACPNETDRQRMCWLNLVACCAGASGVLETFGG